MDIFKGEEPTQVKIVRFQNWKNIGKTLGKQWNIIGNSTGKPILEKDTLSNI